MGKDFDRNHPEYIYLANNYPHTIKDGSTGWRSDYRFDLKAEGVPVNSLVNNNVFTLETGKLSTHLHTGMGETIVLLEGEEEKVVVVIRDAEGRLVGETKLKKGQSVYIPTGAPHTIVNIGERPAQMLAIGVKTKEGGVTEPYLSRFSLVKDPKLVDSSDVDLSQKDGDSRKTKYFRTLLMNNKEVFALWSKLGILDKRQITDEMEAYRDARFGHSVRRNERFGKVAWERREYSTAEHMLVVTAGAQALAQMAVEKGYLEKEDVDFVAIEAALLHDTDKDLEMLCVRKATSEVFDVDSFVGEIKGVLKKTYGINNFVSFGRLLGKFKEDVRGRPAGERGVFAFDLAAELGKKILMMYGFNKRVVDVQKMVAFNTCPDMGVLIQKFDRLRGRARRLAILALIMHYMDDIVIQPNVIDTEIDVKDGVRRNVLDRRMDQNESNPKYEAYNLAWQSMRRSGDETAFQTRRRVGRLVESKLAQLLEAKDPLTLPGIIDARIRENIKGTSVQKQ